MRNVDRDVLREAIAIADLQDIFTPTFQVDLFSKLEELAERNRLLEALAFGTVIVRLFRVTIFFIRLLPSTRAMLIAIAVLVAVDRALASEKIPGVSELKQFAADAGIGDITGDIVDQVQEALAPIFDQLQAAEQFIGQGLLEISRELGILKGKFGTVEELVRNANWTRAVVVSEQLQATGFSAVNNLTDNLLDLGVIPMGQRIQELRDFDLGALFGKPI